MASLSVYSTAAAPTLSSLFLSESVLNPSRIPSPIPVVHLAPSPSCIAGRSLCPDGIATPMNSSDNTDPDSDDSPPLAPMPFATPLTTQPRLTMTSTARQPGKTQNASSNLMTSPTHTLFVTMTAHPSSSSSSSSAKPTPTPTMDPMMHGNPEPRHPPLRPPYIIAIAILGALSLTTIPLLIFSVIVKYKLKKAIAFQLGQGPRQEREWGVYGWEEKRRDFVVDEGFLKGFRRRAGRAWV
ncbi:MAG: hypothetical protein Q9219_005780 [cf. Caloplaca sp. 3 TL-2023]